ncbi:complement C5-like [Pundamilia nyererei]|uniref:Complement C5-like n=1 Tax=Pundamilia nyererei TaxID=303518 RepID=A0A9Y3S790_9CICH|nr:PREDICTED: complement C5-like [Pundamilia nyererei]
MTTGSESSREDCGDLSCLPPQEIYCTCLIWKVLSITAYKVTVTKSAAEGDFMTYTATVDEVIKNTDKDFEGVRSGTVVDLVKKATCSDMDIQNNRQYLLMGASGSEVTLDNNYKYRLPLDSEAVLELWPTECSSPECRDYISQLDDFAESLQFSACS